MSGMERFVAIVAFASFAIFNLVTVGFIREPDLTIITVIVLALAGFDFWKSLAAKRNGN